MSTTNITNAALRAQIVSGETMLGQLAQAVRQVLRGNGNRTNAGNPNGVLTPQNRGERVWDTTNSREFVATGLTNTSWFPTTGVPVTAEVSGTGSTVTVNLGFTPSYVMTLNLTDFDVQYEWTDTMANGTAIEHNKAGSISQLASEGITPITTAGSEGFQIGTTISENSKRIAYVAHP